MRFGQPSCAPHLRLTWTETVRRLRMEPSHSGVAEQGLVAARAPPAHIAPLLDLEALRRDGYLVLPDVLPVETAMLTNPAFFAQSAWQRRDCCQT
eukprot:COSAG02_NODE_25509_length_657_cov_0.485663_1_plen_95_part_00